MVEEQKSGMSAVISVIWVGVSLPQTERCLATSYSRMTALLLIACLSSLEITGKSMDATVRYIVSHCLFVSFAFEMGKGDAPLSGVYYPLSTGH